ncbi:hypothetical protein FNV43_RR19241 [Rhamnella rubrinervis]|uniref:glycerophosphodiester phosphodiesterase n=1 Tax=Rhamnella rubrinervis TaxID=2594499 RepID=A0A8K0E7V0_9ROSA|nr:hypothetical protein FNV43_RR19241 [Rhamnella rubrinervis]
MALPRFSGRLGRRPLLQRHVGHGHRDWRYRFPFRFSSPRLFRTTIITLAFIALFPPIFFHFKLRRFHQIQSRKCGWLTNPPLVCAHGGDSTNAFPNTISAYQFALRSQADCVEIDVSRSSDGVLFALHDRDLQRISGNNTSKVGHFSMKEIKELAAVHQSTLKFGETIPTIEDALKLMSSSVRQVILDAKVGPPLYEKGLARDILKVVERTRCKNCIVWAKSDNLARDVIKQSSDVTVGYIVMIDPSTKVRTNLLRVKGAGVVGVYHPLIDEKLMRVLHGTNKKIYAWTVDDVDSMQRMLTEHVDAVVTSNPGLLQRLMQDLRTQCLEEVLVRSKFGFNFDCLMAISGLSIWFHNKVVDPLLQILSRGAEPKLLAFSAALGITLGVFPICGVTVFLCGVAIALLGSFCHAPSVMLANFMATPIELSLVVPFLRFGEAICGGPHFPLTSDALKKVLTGQASHELLLSIAHALLGWLIAAPFILATLYIMFLPCFTILVRKFSNVPLSPKKSLHSHSEIRLKVRDV